MKNSIIIVFALLSASTTFSQDYKARRDWMSPNGEVRTIDYDTLGNRVFFAGGFDYVGYNAPYGAQLDTLNGMPNWSSAFPTWKVETAISDDNGGWLICGQFIKVGDSTRNHLAHIGPNGEVMSTFGQQNLDGIAYAMKKDGDTLYLGGQFDGYGSVKNVLALTDSIFGVNAFNFPEPNIGGTIWTVIPDGLGGWYVGGNFTQIGGINRTNVAHIDAVGQVDSWNPGANGTVYALAVANGNVYIGGSFTIVGGQSRSNLAEVDGLTGLASLWSPNPDNSISTLKISNNKLFVGGSFNNISSSVRSKLASYDLPSTMLTSWNPIPNGNISAMEITLGSVYVAGTFTTINGMAIYRLGAVDEITGDLLPWTPGLTSGQVMAMAVSSSTLYVGGSFTSIGGQSRQNIAAVDLITALPTSWNPTANNMVLSMHASGNKVYAGGNFTTTAGQARNRVAAFNLNTGSLENWNPNASSSVYAISVDNGQVIIGGIFDQICSVGRKNLMAIDLTTSMPTIWDPKADDVVYDMAIRGDSVFVCGNFLNLNTTQKWRVAAVNKTNGAVYSGWTCSSTSVVTSLELSGDSLFVGGAFTNLDGSSRDKVALVGATNSVVVNSWAPDPNGKVEDMILKGNTLYISGNFTSFAGANRNYLGAINVSSATATTWNPNADNFVREMVILDDNVYVIGDFNTMGGLTRKKLAKINLTTGITQTWNPFPEHYVSSLVSMKTITGAGSKVFVGGDYQFIGGDYRNGFASVDGTNGQLTNWSPNVAGTDITKLLIHQDKLFLGGQFLSVEGQTRNGLASYDLSTLNLTTFNPGAWSALGEPGVFELFAKDNILYVGGEFGTLGGVSRLRIGAINLTTGLTTSWNPGANEDIGVIKEYNGLIYVGGYFTSIGGQTRNKIAALSPSTGSATSWNPVSNIRVTSIDFIGDTAFVGGHFSTLGGQPREKLGAVSLSTGFATPWNPISSGYVYDLAIKENEVFVVGQFATIGGTTVSSLSAIDATTGIISSTFELPGTSNDIELMPDKVVIGGGFGFVGDQQLSHMAAYESCINVSGVLEDISCFGLNDGSVDISVTNNTGPYTVNWNNGTYFMEDLTNLGAGSYTLEVIDSVGCVSLKTFTIAEPALLEVNGVPTNVTCYGGNNGSIDLTVVGGVPNYTYDWNNGASSSQDLTSIIAGSYNVTVTDLSGCQNTATFDVIQFPEIITSYNQTNVSCNGAMDGSIDHTTAGGAGSNLLYSWNNGIYSTEDLSTIGGGIYTLTVTDSVGCTATDIVTIIEPSAIDVSTTISFPSITANNGLASSYQWVDCNDNMNSILTENNATFTALINGSYAVIVTEGSCVDTSACQLISTISILENEGNSMVSISPNPTNKLIWVESMTEPIESIEILSVSGTTLQKHTTINLNKTHFSIEGEPGVYLLKYSLSNGKQNTVRVIKI